MTMSTITTNESSSCSEFESQEESLRALIERRPKNGRAMAQLACLLFDQAKLYSCEVPRAASLRQEGLEWAHCSVQIAPYKPYGYMALSVLESEGPKRMQALRQAVQLKDQEEEEKEDSSYIKLGLLIRLLIDPRYYESLQVSGNIGKASCKHPNKRQLDASEEKLYKRISVALDDFWSRTTTELAYNQEQMASTEYRLGLFFRKKLPTELSKPRAKRHLQRALQYLPKGDDKRPIGHFWLGTLGDDTAIDRCPASYIVGLYSTFAERFDKLLVEKLAYETPTLVRKLLDGAMSVKLFDKGLDLGCGTGLSGLAFRDKVQHLIGVDLSPEMIAKARERKCYDVLEVGDVTTCLGAYASSSFDLIFACDVFVYLGDLRNVFSSVHKVLTLNGVFAFSTELLVDEDEDSNGTDFVLHVCARFSHSRTYIERLASVSSFKVLEMAVRTLRKNQGKDVKGLLSILTKETS